MFESKSQEDVQSFIASSTEARRLINRHRELDRVVIAAKLGLRPVDDQTLVTTKKEKLRAKDRLNYLWEKHESC
jgi:uncharacterized protein YdcH (DUF465 family)